MCVYVWNSYILFFGHRAQTHNRDHSETAIFTHSFQINKEIPRNCVCYREDAATRTKTHRATSGGCGKRERIRHRIIKIIIIYVVSALALPSGRRRRRPARLSEYEWCFFVVCVCVCLFSLCAHIGWRTWGLSRCAGGTVILCLRCGRQRDPRAISRELLSGKDDVIRLVCAPHCNVMDQFATKPIVQYSIKHAHKTCQTEFRLCCRMFCTQFRALSPALNPLVKYLEWG